MAPPVVTVPDVTGLSRADAEAAIATAYLNTGAVTYEYSPAVPEGHVILQSPPAGTTVKEDSAVDLVICLQSGEAPVITCSADPATITSGQSSELTWATEHADSVTIDQGIGPVALSGSMWVSPLETTTYTITATGPGDTASEIVMVTVSSPPAPIATFTADPEVIMSGESSTLSWTTQNANSVSIDQGIGTVAASGSMLVSSSETITYTLTATGAGGTVTQSVTVTINPLPQPTVTITADPASIIIGESTTLTWSSADAVDAVIDQGIGAVPLSGSTTVSPTETTTYTITATGPGPGGTATDSVTITVNFLAPTASITADPPDILAGESSTLSWSSTNADSCIIEPEIGDVAIEGSMSVSPGQTTTYTLSATGLGGTSSASATITVISPISLQITSPEDGETLSTSDVTVKGTITNLNGNETGVVVDGMPAQVYDDQFFINLLPLEDGSNTITVVVTDASGAQVTQEILLFADLPSDYIRIHASLEAGLAPMETELYVRGSFSLNTAAVIESSGPGPITFIESGIDQFYVRFSTAGIYYITATATDGAVFPLRTPSCSLSWIEI